MTGLTAAVFGFSSLMTIMIGGVVGLASAFVLAGPMDHPGLIRAMAVQILGYVLITNTCWNIDSVLNAFRSGRQLLWVRLTQASAFLVIAVVYGLVDPTVWGLVWATIGSWALSLLPRIRALPAPPCMRHRGAWSVFTQGRVRRGFLDAVHCGSADSEREGRCAVAGARVPPGAGACGERASLCAVAGCAGCGCGAACARAAVRGRVRDRRRRRRQGVVFREVRAGSGGVVRVFRWRPLVRAVRAQACVGCPQRAPWLPQLAPRSSWKNDRTALATSMSGCRMLAIGINAVRFLRGRRPGPSDRPSK